MKRIAMTLSILVLIGTGMKAQSCDAAYPEGNWINEIPGVGEERPYNVDITVHRVTEIDKEHQNRMNCGYIVVTDHKTEQTIYEGHLNYSGKGFEYDMYNGKYYFKVTTPNGQEHVLGLKKTGDGLQMVSLTGSMGNHAFLKESCFLAPMNGSWTPATIEPTTEAELLKSLEDALDDYDKDRIAYRTRGFGNVRQYINTHRGLKPNLPKYAKPKGANAVNIRKGLSATAPKIGELKPGQTLLVIDEFDGWCQVKMDENTSGCVSLSVVTLTNTPSKAASAATTASATPTACPLTGDWYGILGNGWGETTVFLQADCKTGVNSKMAKRQSNGAIDMTDDAFESEWNYNLVFNRTVSENTYEFTVQRMVGKQLKSGKLQVKRNGDRITMTGLDAWTKQQPFHGKTLGKPNPVYQ